MAELLKFSGTRVREHLGRAGCGGHSLSRYGLDQSGTKTYSFNSRGFRGEDLNPESALRVFVCGCSYTFGTGLDIEETWAHGLKLRLAERLQVDPFMVNLVNFAQGGASNDYVTRELISQCSKNKPDVIFANFTHSARFEICERETAVQISGDIEEFRHTPWIEQIEHRTLAMSDLDNAMQFLKNILLLQSYCQAHSIQFILSALPDRGGNSLANLGTPLMAPLLSLIDFDRWVQLDWAMVLDRAADGSHPGPIANQNFARAIWATYERVYPISSLSKP